jgi:hypothetical protein
MTVAHQAVATVVGQLVGMVVEQGRNFGLDGLRQQRCAIGARVPALTCGHHVGAPATLPRGRGGVDPPGIMRMCKPVTSFSMEPEHRLAAYAAIAGPLGMDFFAKGRRRRAKPERRTRRYFPDPAFRRVNRLRRPDHDRFARTAR